MNKEQFLKKYNLTEDQFNGREEVGGSLDLSSLTSIPDGFNPTVGGWLYLSSLTSIPDGFNPTVGGWLDLSSLTSIPDGFNPTVGGWLYLRSLTSIPDGFNPTVGGWLDLRSLTSIPDGFNPTVGGSLYLRSLTSIPDGFNPTVGGWLDLRSLTSIPDGFNPTVGGSLYLRSLTSIPDGFNPTIGGWLDLSSGLSAPTKECPDVIEWLGGKIQMIDGIIGELVSTKKNVKKFIKIASEEVFYVVEKDNKYAHGKTIREANQDLLFKINGRNKSQYESLDIKSILPIDEAIVCYRVITGACSFGVSNFLEKIEKVKDEYSISEIITLTNGEYGGSSFKSFFYNPAQRGQ